MGVKSTDSNSPYYDIFGPTAPGGSDAPLAFLPPPELTEEQISSNLVYRWYENAYQADNTTGWVVREI